jgi:hypothetical protein
MKKFIVLMSLVGMLSSCTVNTSTVRPDEGMKELNMMKINSMIR